MNDDIMARMIAEKSAIQQRMAGDARKLEAVDRFIEAYQPSAKAALRSSTAPRPARSFVDRIDKFGSYGKAIIDAVTKLLPGLDGNPVPTRDLVAALETRGVDIRGENKVNALSALLARSSQIKGHGRSGWTLAGDQPSASDERIPGDDKAQNENEPTGKSAVGSETAGWGVQPPRPAFGNPQSGWAS